MRSRRPRKEGIEVEKILVLRRIPGEYHSESEMVEGRDYFVDELLEDYEGQQVEPESMPAEDTLFLMYTSGTTGRPKGAQHSIGGYLSYVAGTSKYYQDIHPDDTYWCFADIGWITGHSYIVYGPLALGTTTVMYEGIPTYPDPGRPWRIAEKLGVDIFHTAPTTIRMLRKVGPDEPAKYDYNFKTMTTVGEPIEPDVWRWYWQGRRQGRGGDHRHLVDDRDRRLPRQHAAVPAADEAGQLRAGVPRDPAGDLRRERRGDPEGLGQGRLHLRAQPVAGPDAHRVGPGRALHRHLLQALQQGPELEGLEGLAVHVRRRRPVSAEDGYFRILGRIDDVINVAGHRLGTKELESAAIEVDEIAEAAAVPVFDEVRGKVVEMYVAVKPGVSDSDEEVAKKVSAQIERDIGKIARPKNVWVVPDMPKTRSGKIMRRVIAGISNFADVGDVSTLANPEVVEEIREQVQGAKKARGEDVAAVTRQEQQEIAEFGSGSE